MWLCGAGISGELSCEEATLELVPLRATPGTCELPGVDDGGVE
jgi:hypothetical protein